MMQAPDFEEAPKDDDEAPLEQLEALKIVEPVTSFEAKTSVYGA